MPQFLVELYLTGGVDRLADTVERARAAAALSTDGSAVRYLRSIVVPGDETCLHLFEAPDAAAVRQACKRVGIGLDRLVEANDISDSAHGASGGVTR
jgi:hypothetical protein